MTSPALKESTEPVDAQVNGNSMGVGEIRLNLGGRGTLIPGFKTVDLSPEHDVDYKTDVSDLSMFEDGSVSEIYASHILEHFPHVKTQSVLKEWARVLKPRGLIHIAVPDFQRTIEIYLKIGLCPWVTNFLYGDQGYPLAYHYAPFTFASLAKMLYEVGFTDIKRVGAFARKVFDCSTLVSNIDGKSVSLNVTATK